MNATPAARWNLDELARVTVDGTEYVVYSDGHYSWAMPAAGYDAETSEEDYSHWCTTRAGRGIGDHALLRRILVAAELEVVYSAGDCVGVSV